MSKEIEKKLPVGQPRFVRQVCCESRCRNPAQWMLEYVDMPARSIYRIYACEDHRTIKGPWKSLPNAPAVATAPKYPD